ncbi:hypothetical protein GMST_26720 [Geomonas silvestris]|uniref:histidine kinase n=1 Tax=Geomonas silvestris TaxID=2740184 RepID=A0A6V8MK98_9BACT|nr:PAS domain-containing protein [Geomonas silvestris]GFO60347.1 hypothetical protein GMST_26720 [Geomonas silvestris]
MMLETVDRRSTRKFLLRLVALVLLVDLCLVALAAFSLQQSRAQYCERVAVQTQNLSLALDSTLAGLIDQADLAVLSVTDEIYRQRAHGGLDAASLSEFMVRQKGRLGEMGSMRVADAQGIVHYGTEATVPGVSLADRDYFTQLRDNPKLGLVISKPVVGRFTGKWALILARRVSAPDGSFAGIVCCTLPLEEILKIFSRMKIGNGGGISLRDADMATIVRHPWSGDFASVVGKKSMSPELSRLVASGKTGGTFFTKTGWDNVAKMVTFHKVGQHPLYIIVGLAAKDFLAQWWRDLVKLSVMVLLFLAASALVSRLVYQRWLQDREAEAALLHSKQELEQRVAQRTAELYQANQQLTTELRERELAEQRLREGSNMLAQVIDTIPQSVFWKNRDSVYLGCNARFAQLAGLASPEAVLGKTDFDLSWPDVHGYRAADRDVMENNRPQYHALAQLPKADGVHWMDTTKIPLCDENGSVYGVLGVTEDITGRREAEESRNQALAFSESLLSASPAAILVYDGESGSCVMANRAASNLIGGSIEDLCRQNLRELSSWRAAGLDRMAEAVLADGQTRHTDATIRSSFNKRIDMDCFLSRCDVAGKPHLMFVGIDISEKKRLEQENKLIEAQMLHVQKLESLGVLAGGIAHDFNNILMVVLGNADLAQMRLPADSPARENLRQIEVAAGRAADLAKQMLAYSGKGRFVIEKLDVNGVVEEMAHMLGVSISKKVVLRYQFADRLPAVNADATQLRQVILNLVLNASEAIGEDRGLIVVATGLRQCDRAYLADSCIDDGLPEGSYVSVEVSDSGCGIRPEIISRIFDPFFTTKFTGRGLGMAAVLGIVRGHQGAIKVRSVPGSGTTFTVLLPVREGAEMAPVSDAAVPAALWKGRGTVLLVDDEETIRKLGREMLLALGFEVLTACDGREAVRVYAENRERIVCVLLDLTMPALDGEQTFQELKLIDPQVRVVISSGYHEQEVARKFQGQGLAGVIQKPYKVTEMSQKLSEVLSG